MKWCIDIDYRAPSRRAAMPLAAASALAGVVILAILDWIAALRIKLSSICPWSPVGVLTTIWT
jgi:hypothetical protein